MRLEGEIYNKVKELCGEADKHVLICEFDQAIEKYNQALELFQGDIEEYEESIMIYAAMGDAYCLAGEYKRARNYFYNALDCSNGIANPYILFRLGECLYECDEKYKAQEYFIRTYMMDGLNLFEKGDKKYLDLIKLMIDK